MPTYIGCHTDNFFEQKVEILSPKNFPHIDLAMKHLLSLENFQETQEDYTRIDLENIFNCNKFERAEICKLPVEKSILSVYWILFQFRTSSTNIYKTVENLDFPDKKVECDTIIYIDNTLLMAPKKMWH